MKKKSAIIISITGVVVLILALVFFIVLLPIIKCNNHIKSGDENYHKSKYKEAVREYKEALNIKPDNKEAKNGMKKAYLAWAEEYAEEGEYEEAIDTYNKVLDIQSENEEAEDGIINAYLAWAESYVGKSEYEKAIKIYKEAGNFKPNNEAIKNGRTNTYIVWADNYAQSEEFEEALNVINKGWEETGSGKTLEAKTEIIDKYVDAEYALGNTNLDEMVYDEAKTAYEKMLELDTDNVDAYLGVIEIEIRNNRFENALNIAKDAYERTSSEKIKEQIDMLESGNIFASNGWTMKFTQYDENKAPVFIHEFSYNLQGKTASVTWEDGDGNYLDHIELKYDDKGRSLVSYSYTVSSGELNLVVREYDGNKYTETNYDGTSDKVSSYEIGTLNDDGLSIEYTCYNSKWEFRFRREEEYNDEGKWTKITDYNEDGSAGESQTMEYEVNGDRKKYCYYKADGSLQEYALYEYNSEHKLIKETSYNADGTIKYTKVYE